MSSINGYPELRPISDGVLQQFYQEKTITLAAGARLEDFTTFNFFRVLSLSGVGLEVIFGNNQFQTPFTGAGLGLELDYILPRLTLINTSGASLTLTYAVAVGRVQDDRLTVSGAIATTSNASSALGTSVDVVVPAATATLVLNGNSQRRTVLITNVGANVARIGDGNVLANRGQPLLVNQSVSIDSTAQIRAYSTLGTTLAFLEVVV